MKHKTGFNPLERRAGARKALKRSMVTSLFRHERIRTTKTKALEVRRTAERLITRAKVDSVHNRRLVSAQLYDEAVVAKLFTEIGPRMKDRNGGYTRVLKLGQRSGDAAEVAILELVDYQLETEDKDKKGAGAKKTKKTTATEATAEKTEKKASKRKSTVKADEGKKVSTHKAATAKTIRRTSPQEGGK
jgi:large subunit ribosomal protein L17